MTNEQRNRLESIERRERIVVGVRRLLGREVPAIEASARADASALLAELVEQGDPAGALRVATCLVEEQRR